MFAWLIVFVVSFFRLQNSFFDCSRRVHITHMQVYSYRIENLCLSCSGMNKQKTRATTSKTARCRKSVWISLIIIIR